jgi:hypothetical protein
VSQDAPLFSDCPVPLRTVPGFFVPGAGHIFLITRWITNLKFFSDIRWTFPYRESD